MVHYGVIKYIWGNVSGIDRQQELVVIKPSGVDYDVITPDDMVVDLKTGKTVDGKYKSSSDTETHLEIYRAFPAIGGMDYAKISSVC